MPIAYVVMTVIAAVGAAAIAYLNLVRHPIPVAAARQVDVPVSWTRPLGILLGAGALGLLAGLVLPPFGTAAAVGLVLYFVGAIVAHLRVRDRHMGAPLGCLAVAAATLAITVAHRLQ